ncbi:hypothetical protein M409DRAFT_17354 [Zasmidium cellare ATCC 36951]|uniref:C2H2-type domain-containing protein n=1 Tax=Zasmidium cellare ATCC 36951 TaxID=1080233 RepID=A0A6A6CY55_ZASCE|nr:uncharacterized protein M409DRAFT_17354 [Zasmidium cellare ATCC 36951]KAF2172114.1 hypothetical protein M409DRAFT_17354 [Zasmidium cellare ATCC 36951]
MANFSLDFDDADFTTEDLLTWDLASGGDHDLGKDHFPQPHHNGVDSYGLSSAPGDPLQGWLDQQVPLNNGPLTDNLNFQHNALVSESSSNLATTTTQTPFQAAPRHDSTTSLQSMASAASSSSRRGQRIVGAYPCAQCDRVFDVPSDLRHHERNHMAANSRPYKCHYCGQRFLYPKDRTRHVLRKHTSAGAQSDSLTRTQSMDDVQMLSADDLVPELDRRDRPIPGLERPAASNPALSGEFNGGIGSLDEVDTGSLREESMRFSESACERLQNRFEFLHKDLMSLRKQRFELAGVEVEAAPVTIKATQSDLVPSIDGLINPTTTLEINKMERLIAQQQLQIDRLKLEVQFATQDAAFWLEECNHYVWFLRKIPKAPRPPIYTVPKQTGRVSLVQYAKGWLGAIGMMFSSSGPEAKDTEVASHLIDRLVDEIDRLVLQD